MRRKLFFVIIAVALFTAVFSPVASASAANGYCSQYYVVRYGDTLANIARWFGTTVWALQNVNYIPNPNFIYAGQTLCISGGYYPPPPPQNNIYVVRYGDTLAGIARYLGVNLYALAQANGIYNLNRIYAGQVLVIPYY